MFDYFGVKEGDILVYVNDIGNKNAYFIGQEYNVILYNGKLCIDRSENSSSVTWPIAISILTPQNFKLKEQNILTQDMLKEGMILECIKDFNYYSPDDFIKGNFYKIQKSKAKDNNDFILEIIPENTKIPIHIKNIRDSGIPHKLSHFKIKEESIMLDASLYAVGTTHNSVNGNNTYTIIKRDVIIDDIPHMIVKSAKGFNSLRNQNTGMQTDTPNPSYDLEIKKKEKIKGWINIYYTFEKDKDYTHDTNPSMSPRFSKVYKTKEAADKNCMANRAACIEVEFEEGEGL